jgi:hypothetical protein
MGKKPASFSSKGHGGRSKHTARGNSRRAYDLDDGERPESAIDAGDEDKEDHGVLSIFQLTIATSNENYRK